MATATEVRQSGSGDSRAQRWAERGKGAAIWCARQLARPRVRLVVIGAVLLLLGATVVTDGVWTLPLLIAGALMIVVAWVGARLDGQFLVEWGENGTGLEFRARIKAPQQQALAAPVPDVAIEEDPDVVEGHADTIEIDVEELRSLVEQADRLAAERADKAKAAAAKAQ